MPNELTRALEALNESDWFDEYLDEVELDSGADPTDVTVDRTGITIYAHEKFGDGQTPYADDPTHHIEQLNHPDKTHGEGVVVYDDGPTDDDYPLELPKHLYFNERRQFNTQVRDLDGLEEMLTLALNAEVSVREIVGVSA